MHQKKCFKCKRRKALTDFYAHPQMADGHLNKCKVCAKKDSKDRDSQKVKAYDRQRAMLPHRVALRAAYSKTNAYKEKHTVGNRVWRSKNREKMRAHNIVARAVKKGTLKKIPCEICGSKKVHAHHHDYLRPLDVQWLCSDHHRLIHKKYG